MSPRLADGAKDGLCIYRKFSNITAAVGHRNCREGHKLHDPTTKPAAADDIIKQKSYVLPTKKRRTIRVWYNHPLSRT